MSEEDEKKTDSDAEAKAEGDTAKADATSDADTASSGLKEQLEAGLEEVKTIATDLGLRLGAAAGGASVEAQEGWKKIEPQVKEKLKVAEAALGEVTDAAAEQLKGLFGELKSSFNKVKEKM